MPVLQPATTAQNREMTLAQNRRFRETNIMMYNGCFLLLILLFINNRTTEQK
jgi:hypothetical protein